MKDEMKSMSANKVWDLQEKYYRSQNSRLQMGLQDEMWLQRERRKI